MGDDRRRRRRFSGEDRISGLPDELLHAVLVRLRSARAAARTSVLSRRWRHVWAHLPELHLGGSDDPPPAPASLPDAVDAALDAHSAPELKLLHIMPLDAGSRPLPAGRAAPWLRFPSRRVVGELHLYAPSPGVDAGEDDESVLDLPACAGAKTISLTLQDSWRLRPEPAGGLFAALTSLTIQAGRMEGSELTALVCRHCPCLLDLSLFLNLVAASDVSVVSDSLRTLSFFVIDTQRLEVLTPRLEKLSVDYAIEARISSPKLAELVWDGVAAYDHLHHKFDDVGRHLRLLETGDISAAASLMRQFDEVDELKLRALIPLGTVEYESFLNQTNWLPKCNILRIYVAWQCHALAPYLLNLLRGCNSTRKLSVQLINYSDPLSVFSCPPSCRCCLAESSRIDDITLSSLEEVEISNFTASSEELKLVEQLSRCNAPVLKKLVINYMEFPAIPLTKEVYEKVHSMWCLDVKVEFYVFLDWRRVCFDRTLGGP